MTNLDTAPTDQPKRQRRAPQPMPASGAVIPETTDFTIAGASFVVPNRYKEGHVLTAGEASQLNQVFHENIRNNMAKKIKESNASHEELQAMVDEYARSYEPGVRQGGGRTADPVRREARELAKAKIIATLKARGEDPKEYTAAAINEAVELNIEKFMEKARRIVEERKNGDVEISLG